MREKSLLLHMYFTKGDTGSLAFTGSRLKKIFRVKNLVNARDFVAKMDQLSRMIVAGASPNGHFILETSDTCRQWLLQYHVAYCEVNLVLMRLDLDATSKFKHVMAWSGSIKEFYQAVDHMIYSLPVYPFWSLDYWTAIVRKWFGPEEVLSLEVL